MKNYGDVNIEATGEIINADIEHGTADPGGSSGPGRLFFRTDLPAMRVYDGTTWDSLATTSTSGVTSISFGSTGLTPSTGTAGVVTVAGTLNLSSGGTNASLTATAGGIVYSTASALAISAAGTSGQIILSGGTGAPTFLTNSTPVDTDGAGSTALIVGSSFNVFGTVNEITTTATSSPNGVTLSIPSTFVAPGSVTATTSVTANILTADTTITGPSSLTSGTAYTIDTVVVATFRTVKYLVQITDATGPAYQATEILIIQDGTTVYKTEYADVYSSGSLGTLDATISGGNMTLTFTPGATATYTIHVAKLQLTV